MKGQTLWGWERGSGGLPPGRWWKDRRWGAGSGGLGVKPQLGDESPPVGLARSGRNNFRKKKVFERTLFEQKFSYNYSVYFSFEFSFEIWVFFERTAFERKPKIRKIRKNEIRKKKMNFERTLFDQTTSSRFNWLYSQNLSQIRNIRFSESSLLDLILTVNSLSNLIFYVFFYNGV